MQMLDRFGCETKQPISAIMFKQPCNTEDLRNKRVRSEYVERDHGAPASLYAPLESCCITIKRALAPNSRLLRYILNDQPYIK